MKLSEPRFTVQVATEDVLVLDFEGRTQLVLQREGDDVLLEVREVFGSPDMTPQRAAFVRLDAHATAVLVSWIGGPFLSDALRAQVQALARPGGRQR